MRRKMVAEAAEDRKQENEDCTELIPQDFAAKEVALIAPLRRRGGTPAGPWISRGGWLSE